MIALAPVGHERTTEIESGHGRGGRRRPPKPVDVNVMKRNMSVAKGFMDISLLSANANQLRNLFSFGDSSSYNYYVILTGLLLSLILQVRNILFLIFILLTDL